MTKFYEVRKRDGAARLGRLLIGGAAVETPLLLSVEAVRSGDAPVLPAGAVTESGNADTDKLLVYDGRGLPAGWAAARGVVVLPETHPLAFDARDVKADLYVVGYAPRLLTSGKRLVAEIIRLRENIPPDAALYVPAVATPANVAFLIYMGVDVVDDAAAVLKGYEDVYLTDYGELRLSELDNFPCCCEVCTSLSPAELRGLGKKERAELLAKHNSLALKAEVERVRERIRSEMLREYVELRVRTSPFLTAALRILDGEETYLEKRTPVARRSPLLANTMESLRRIEVKRFAARVIERYTPPHRKVLLLLPCSARKPYSQSQSHRKFISAISEFRGHIHEVIITSPLGVVPRELEAVYPAAFYDVPVTGYWDAEERSWVGSCIEAYLRKNLIERGLYEHVVVHLGGGALEIFKGVAEKLGLEAFYTCGDGEEETAKRALERLRSCISELCAEKLPDKDAKANMIRAMADYQFGSGVGDVLLEGAEIEIKGKYPAYKVVSGGEALAEVAPEYGLLRLSLSGALRLHNSGFRAYEVRLRDFVPKAKSAVLAPAVEDADPQIRVSDEVLLKDADGNLVGVGRAKMSGWEMVAAERGVAVEVRKTLDRSQHL